MSRSNNSRRGSTNSCNKDLYKPGRMNLAPHSAKNKRIDRQVARARGKAELRNMAQ